MKHRDTRGAAGFTLIELLVVVLIIGILASIAIPQYFKVVERARVTEAQSFIATARQAQERYLARQGSYITDNTKIDQLDITFAGPPPSFGMKFYEATFGVGAGGTGCQAGDPAYSISLKRVTTGGTGLATRYGASYTVRYERCNAAGIDYPGCAACDTDFK